jgi:hypothetical protein
MGAGRTKRQSLGIALVALMLVAVPAESALADARVRVVNAAGGSEPVELQASVDGKPAAVGGALAFGQVGGWVSLPAGEAELRLSGGSKAPKASESLKNGKSYTVVVISKGENGMSLQTLKNGKGKGGEARLRVFHAAPELGSPDVRIGKRTIAQGVSFRSATPYVSLSPGSYTLAVTKPDGGDTVFSRQVSLAAGTAATVIVTGSGGSAAQAIMVDDAAVTPGGAPGTGLGGLAEGGGAAWALALLAALVAGTLGGAVQLTRTRRSRT